MASALAISATGCNIFDPIDNPGSDEQLLSAGYACLDNGDATCAAEYFGRVAPSNERGQAAQAFATLDQRAIGIREFITAFGNGGTSGGKALTQLANGLAAAGQTTAAARTAFHDAFLRTQNIPTQVQLRGMVRLVSAIAVAASVLATQNGIAGHLLPGDLVTTPAGCNVGNCAASANCDAPASNTLNYTTLAGGADEFLPTTSGALAGTPDTVWLYEAIQEMQKAVGSTELNVQGGIGNAVRTFANGILNVATYNTDNGSNTGSCFRFFLVNFEVGGY